MGQSRGARAKTARDEAISEQRRENVLSLYLQGGLSYRQIAEKVGVSLPTVSREITRARANWRESTGKTYEGLLPEKLAQIDRLRIEAWKGWKLSLEDAVSQREEVGENAQGPYRKLVKAKKGQSGDPRFLNTLESLLKLECQLRGMLDVETVNNSVTVNAIEVVIENREQKEQFDQVYTLDGFRKLTG